MFCSSAPAAALYPAQVANRKAQWCIAHLLQRPPLSLPVLFRLHANNCASGARQPERAYSATAVIWWGALDWWQLSPGGGQFPPREQLVL